MKRVLRFDGIPEEQIPTKILRQIDSRKYYLKIKLLNGDVKYAYTDEINTVEKYLKSINAKILEAGENQWGKKIVIQFFRTERPGKKEIKYIKP